MQLEKKFAPTPFGDIAYSERGNGDPALFVHGILMNGYLWRHVIERVADLRRCIAIDLMGHGATRTAPEQDVSFRAEAEMLAAFCDPRDSANFVRLPRQGTLRDSPPSSPSRSLHADTARQRRAGRLNISSVEEASSKTARRKATM